MPVKYKNYEENITEKMNGGSYSYNINMYK